MTIGERTAHLTVEELIDVAEDARVEASVPHLAVCERCRDQLTELRMVIASAHEADVPEPSPLFWTEFSRRVSDVIATERPPSRRWFEWTRPRVFVPATAAVVAAIAVAFVLTPVERMASPAPPAAPTVSAAVESPAGEVTDAESDSSLNLVADLTAGIDLTAAMDAGLTPRDSAEHAITHMDADELRALERLLREAIARGGA
jgi:hypothetical protein